MKEHLQPVLPVLFLLGALLLLQSSLAASSQGQTVKLDTSKVIAMPPVVVTATRTPKQLEDVAVPTTIISEAQIAAQGAVRLSDVLAEITGLALFEDHGTGIQVQGFAPDYTLLLIDGEPVIGRTAGTLDLERLSVAGIDRVEVVRGPSSSLYGSEALAGVINLITRSPNEEVSGSLRSRFGTHATTDLTASVEAGGDRFSASAFVNRFSSDGYDLTPDVFGATTPDFVDYTTDVRLQYAPADRLTLHLGARLARQDQESLMALDAVPYVQTEQRVDWSLHPEAKYRLSNRLRLEGTLYAARYQTESRIRQQAEGTPTSTDDFDQRYGKAEVQANAIWNTQHLTTFGGGVTNETLGGARYEVADPEAQAVFAFAQHEWLPGRLLELNVSARLDAHSDYSARLSPKASVLVRPFERLRLRASVGSGFKAPDFRQLYLTYTNPAVGYSVLGSIQFETGLQRLQDGGLISEVFIQPAQLETIRAESSVAFNAGLSATLFEGVNVSLGVFHNDVDDLIETQPVAQKTNGSFVYSYFNLNRIYTRGIEGEMILTPLSGLTVTAGYQFLQARDREVVEAIRGGRVFGRGTGGRDYRLDLADYGGLLGRSPHTGNLRLAYQSVVHGLTLTLRGQWRSRYGYRDVDGNGLANRGDEFVPGYALWNATVTKDWTVPVLDRVTLQLGADNLFSVTKPTLIPSLPGRTLYAGLQVYL